MKKFWMAFMIAIMSVAIGVWVEGRVVDLAGTGALFGAGEIDIVRVHDVAETVDALRVYREIVSGARA